MPRKRTKPFPLLMVLVFSWLVTYQLCDATEHMLEDLNDRASVAAQPHPSLSTPQMPETEPDALIPQVQNQALVTGQVPLMHQGQSISLPLEKVNVVTSAPTRIPQDHHPPGSQNDSLCRVRHSNNPFVSSVQRNAPPAA